MVAFLYFFGIPSVTSYLDKQVLSVTSKKNPGKEVPPTITILAYNSSNGGWNQSVPTEHSEALKSVCGESVNMVSCINQKSHSLEQTVFANLGYDLKQSLMTPDLWIEDFTHPWYGRSYTLKSQEPRGNDWRIDNIMLQVNTSDGLDRKIFFHDPDYFIINLNPLALPITLQTM
jgi:hypothetical protein